MANEAEKFGLPQIIINFRTKSVTAIARSARGIGVMILNNEETNTSNFYKISRMSRSSRKPCLARRCACWSTRCRRRI